MASSASCLLMGLLGCLSYSFPMSCFSCDRRRDGFSTLFSGRRTFSKSSKVAFICFSGCQSISGSSWTLSRLTASSMVVAEGSSSWIRFKFSGSGPFFRGRYHKLFLSPMPLRPTFAPVNSSSKSWAEC